MIHKRNILFPPAFLPQKKIIFKKKLNKTIPQKNPGIPLAPVFPVTILQEWCHTHHQCPFGAFNKGAES